MVTGGGLTANGKVIVNVSGTGFVEGVELGPIVWVRESVSALVTGETVRVDGGRHLK